MEQNQCFILYLTRLRAVNLIGGLEVFHANPLVERAGESLDQEPGECFFLLQAFQNKYLEMTHCVCFHAETWTIIWTSSTLLLHLMHPGSSARDTYSYSTSTGCLPSSKPFQYLDNNGCKNLLQVEFVHLLHKSALDDIPNRFALLPSKKCAKRFWVVTVRLSTK